MPPSSILSLQDIHFAYPHRAAIFSGLDFTLHEGEQIGLDGPNGCGKTTLLRVIMGLETPQKGAVFFHGAPVADRTALHRLRCSVGFILQNSDDQLFSPTVLEDVAFGPLNLGLDRVKARNRAMETLESMGVAELANRPAHQLSGGEKKMAAIASVLSMRPEALLLDEPTIFLDDNSRDRIIEILQRQTIARIVVSHDTNFLRQTSASHISIRNGKIHPLAEL